MLIVSMVLIQMCCNSTDLIYNNNETIPTAAAQYLCDSRVINETTIVVENSSVATDITLNQLIRYPSVTNLADNYGEMTLWNASHTFRSTFDSMDYCDWSYAESATFCELTTGAGATGSVVESNYRHTDTRRFLDNNMPNNNEIHQTYFNFPSAPNSLNTELSFEFLCHASATTTSLDLAWWLIGTSSENIMLTIQYAGSAPTLYYKNSGGTLTALKTLSFDGWTHIRLRQVTLTTYNIWIDEVYKGNFALTYTAGSIGDYFEWFKYESNAATTIDVSIDCIDVSFATHYFIDRNQFVKGIGVFNNIYPGNYYFQTTARGPADVYYSSVQTLTIAIQSQNNNTQLISESTKTTLWQFSDYSLKEVVNLNKTTNWGNFTWLEVPRVLISEDTYVRSGSNTNYNTAGPLYVRHLFAATYQETYCNVILNTAHLQSLNFDHLNLTFNSPGATTAVRNPNVYGTAETIIYSTVGWSTRPDPSTQTDLGTFSGVSLNSLYSYLDPSHEYYTIAINQSYTNYVVRFDAGDDIISMLYSVEMGTGFDDDYRPFASITNKNFFCNQSIISIDSNASISQEIAIPLNNIKRNDLIAITFNNSASISISGGLENYAEDLSGNGMYTKYLIAEQDYNNTNLTLEVDSDATSICTITNVSIFNATGNPFLNKTLNPYGTVNFQIDPGNYGYVIWESGVIVEFSFVTINLTENILVFDRQSQTLVQIALTDMSVAVLNFADYIVNVNYIDLFMARSMNLTTNTFYADTGTNITYVVRDRIFGSIIASSTTLVSTIINIPCNVFTLRIRNNMEKVSFITINATYSSNILIGEQINLQLPQAFYNLTYLNDALTPLSEQITINLDKNFALQLNTTKNAVFFGIFGNDGFGFADNTFRFYIDNEPRNLGYNVVNSQCLVTVLDYFNATVYNSTIYTGNISAYNIYASVFTLTLYSNHTESMRCTIERTDLTFSLLDVIIGANTPISFRFLANQNYKISWYYTNGTLAQVDRIQLIDNKRLSFGIYSYETPQLTKSDLQSQIFDWVYLVVLMAIVVLATIYVGQQSKAKNYPKKNDPVMDQIEQRTIHRKQRTWGVRI